MEFVSLKNPHKKVTLEEAINRGISPDGSLYVPVKIPTLSTQNLKGLKGTSSAEVAKTILTPWLVDEIPQRDIDALIKRACSFPTPLSEVGDKYVLELFHGPTLAFKDVAAAYLAAIMEYFGKRSGKKQVVLVATSGDTGGAIAHGFGDLKNIQVVVLFPQGGVSELQREQLIRTARNVISLEVAGTFDDCQEMVKGAFADHELSKKLNLTSANSISIGRLIPQITYYAYVFAQLKKNNLRFVVPSGNLGNLTAGLYARAMGIPIQSFLAANNRNDVLTRYLETGEYDPHKSIKTFSNAMDVGAPNNFPRIVDVFHNTVDEMRKVVAAVSISDVETAATIKKVYKQYKYLLDPHTAVAWAASEKFPDKNSTTVIVSTASPLKFAREIQDRTGIQVDNSGLIKELQKIPQRVTQISAEDAALKEVLRSL